LTVLTGSARRSESRWFKRGYLDAQFLKISPILYLIEQLEQNIYLASYREITNDETE